MSDGELAPEDLSATAMYQMLTENRDQQQFGQEIMREYHERYPPEDE